MAAVLPKIQEDFPSAPASSVKRDGWRGVMRTVTEKGRLVVTNHRAPEAVILSIEEYRKLMNELAAARQATPDPLQALRQQFDQRLASLQADDAGERLRALMRAPATLDGQVKAGTGY